MRKSIEELLATHKPMATGPALEVLEQICQALLALPELTLKDGSNARIESFTIPNENADGEFECGVDVRFADGSYLEFMLLNTGWGRPLITRAGMVLRFRKPSVRLNRHIPK